MKKVITEESNSKTILLSGVREETPIFAYLNGKLVGMVVGEVEGWMLRLGGRNSSTGIHTTRTDCLLSSRKCRDYEFFIESW